MLGWMGTVTKGGEGRRWSGAASRVSFLAGFGASPEADILHPIPLLWGLEDQSVVWAVLCQHAQRFGAALRGQRQHFCRGSDAVLGAVVQGLLRVPRGTNVGTTDLEACREQVEAGEFYRRRHSEL